LVILLLVLRLPVLLVLRVLVLRVLRVPVLHFEHLEPNNWEGEERLLSRIDSDPEQNWILLDK
jgi:hypothetical protein